MNKEDAMNLVKDNGLLLRNLSERFKDDEDVVTMAVKQNGWAVEYVSNNFKNDKNIVLVALDTISLSYTNINSIFGVIDNLFGKDIVDLMGEITSVRDLQLTLQSVIEKEKLNENITRRTHKKKLNKI